MLFFDKINWRVKACFDMKKQAFSLHKSQAMFFVLALNSPKYLTKVNLTPLLLAEGAGGWGLLTRGGVN
ncbi:MAG: hypothetical protein B6242_12620 [Anaerolineaceae bacterium 4572_78]|nr:MAG: hypothetical protein B6242_12620 [Anaerolineaceae bacterium 4572_78]